MGARSKRFCNKCNAAGLEQNVSFCIPTFQLDRSGDKQGSPRKCRSNDTSGTHMADTTLLYSSTKNVHTTSIANTSPPKLITKLPGRKTSKPAGKHPRVCALLTGAFNQRPPRAHYTFVWDVETVLVYLKTNIFVNSHLSDRDLTHKLTVLMVLSSASRASSLQYLNIKFMARNDMSYKFHFHKLHESWRRGKAPPTISY